MGTSKQTGTNWQKDSLFKVLWMSFCYCEDEIVPYENSMTATDKYLSSRAEFKNPRVFTKHKTYTLSRSREDTQCLIISQQTCLSVCKYQLQLTKRKPPMQISMTTLRLVLEFSESNECSMMIAVHTQVTPYTHTCTHTHAHAHAHTHPHQ